MGSRPGRRVLPGLWSRRPVGPSGIDIVDGQTRYEVGRSLVEHGDSVIRDERVWFWVLPGRDGQRYTNYRFPQSLAAVPAILLADATGPASEARRHFFFSLTGAVACGILAVIYTLFFSRLGFGPRAACGWSLLGIFCTPSWFYGTSTFDDILGTTTVLLAVLVAFRTRRRWTGGGAAVAGLLIGLAFNCKEPLGVFALVVVAAQYDPTLSLRRQWGRIGLVCCGLMLGVAAYKAYDLYKFPPGTTAGHAEEIARYVPTWPGNPLAGLCGLLLSPGAGAFWYCPPLVLACFGLRKWWQGERRFCAAVLAASAIFLVFIASITYFTGDPAWGPRYLTPVFALAWVFVPAGAALFAPRVSRLVLGLSILVQVLGLSVDPHRLYIERGLPSAFYQPYPWLYFHPAIAHLSNRPREIVEVLSPSRPASEAFTPSPGPTFAFPVIHPLTSTPPESIRRYHVLNSLRPWWVSQWFLTPEERPVDLLAALGLLLGMVLASVFLLQRSIQILELSSGTAVLQIPLTESRPLQECPRA